MLTACPEFIEGLKILPVLSYDEGLVPPTCHGIAEGDDGSWHAGDGLAKAEAKPKG
jgi:hypothetical protein